MDWMMQVVFFYWLDLCVIVDGDFSVVFFLCINRVKMNVYFVEKVGILMF